MNRGRLVLASRSPRRRELLEAAGWEVHVSVAPVDDSDLAPGASSPPARTSALAWLKACAVHRALIDSGTPADVPIVAGDTVCEHRGLILGQPDSPEEATVMIQTFRGATHHVWTGLCVVYPDGTRRMGVDQAAVTLKWVSDADIETYVASGAWQGKAGGYNLADRIDAGWPIRHQGHASTIMGMPLPLLEKLLEEDAA